MLANAHQSVPYLIQYSRCRPNLCVAPLVMYSNQIVFINRQFFVGGRSCKSVLESVVEVCVTCFRIIDLLNYTLTCSLLLHLVSEVMDTIFKYGQFQSNFTRTYKNGDNINDHLLYFTKQFAMSKLDSKHKVNMLMNSLDADVQYELFSLLDYCSNADNYEWITNSLMAIFGTKHTLISPLAKLLQVRQSPHQSTRDFLSQIRINGYKIFGDADPQKREKAMIAAFLKGLSDRSLATAAETMEFATLDDCFKAVKKETRHSSPTNAAGDCWAIANSGQGQIGELLETVKLLKTQVTFLVNEINKLRANTNIKLQQQPQRSSRYINTQSNTRCFKCNELGHFARNCRKAAYCTNCKKTGHNSTSCWMRKSVNQIAQDNNFVENEEMSDREIEEDCETPAVYCVSDAKINNKRNVSFTKKSTVIEKSSYPAEINNWANYINGSGKRPKHNYAEVTKLNDINQAGRNKPIVSALIENEKQNIFLDSGAELNVISSDLAEKIISSNKYVRCNNITRNLRCANGSLMQSSGKIELNVSFFPGMHEKMYFDIVPLMKQQVLCGIRQMKRSNIKIEPSKNCAFYCNVKIPFLSKIYPPTEFSGNGRSQPLNRA